MNDRLKPLETIEVSIRLWWILAILMVLGGGSGYIIFALVPPTYESLAEFSFLIDYTKTEKLTDIESDQASVTAGDVFLSTEVVNNVIDAAAQQGIVLTQESFRRNAFVDHTNSEWILRFRSNQSKTSMDLVNIWADQSLITLKNGLNHALISNYYHRQLDSLARCVEQVTSVEPSAPVCGFTSMKELQQTVEKVSALEKGEADKSLALMSSLTFSLTQRAESPGQAVGEGRSVFIMAGIFLGLFVFILFNGVFLSMVKKNRAV
jgi:hypothetical protein